MNVHNSKWATYWARRRMARDRRRRMERGLKASAASSRVMLGFSAPWYSRTWVMLAALYGVFLPAHAFLLVWLFDLPWRLLLP